LEIAHNSVMHDTATAAVTDVGRDLCNQLVDDVFAAMERSRGARAAWPSIAATYSLRWNLCSNSRLVGGLPTKHNGHAVVDGPHRYVIKIIESIDQPAGEQLPNYTEAIIWAQAVRHDLAHVFAPIIDRGRKYRWIVMEEVDVLGTNACCEHGSVPYHDVEQNGETLAQAFETAFSDVPGEFGVTLPGQIGVDRSGTVVAVDYAHLCGRAWAGMYDHRLERQVSFADLRRWNRTNGTASIEQQPSSSNDSKIERFRHWISSFCY
jgi:hypothetical protein